MIIKAKQKGLPRGAPFPKGNTPNRNAGGKPFIKWRQKLSVITAETLSDVASDADCRLVGLPVGSSKASVVAESMFRQALEGNVAAARFLFDCTEAARIRLDVHAEVDLTVYDQAIAALDRITGAIPVSARLPEGEPS